MNFIYFFRGGFNEFSLLFKLIVRGLKIIFLVKYFIRVLREFGYILL